MQSSACAMHVIPMITIKSNLLKALMHVLQVITTGIHTDSSDNIIYHIPLMTNTNIMTGYTYVHTCNCILQVLPGLKFPVSCMD